MRGILYLEPPIALILIGLVCLLSKIGTKRSLISVGIYLSCLLSYHLSLVLLRALPRIALLEVGIVWDVYQWTWIALQAIAVIIAIKFARTEPVSQVLRGRKYPAKNEPVIQPSTAASHPAPIEATDGKIPEVSPDWWAKRQSLPRVRGHITTSEAPDQTAFFPVEGGRAKTFYAAAALIEAFETGIVNLHTQHLRLMDVELREKSSLLDQSKIPLCPNPLTTPADEVPDRIRSVGVTVDYSKFHEIWFIARVSLAYTGFTWRLDWTVRGKTAAKAVSWAEMPFAIDNLLRNDDTGTSAMERPRENAALKAKEHFPTILQVWSEALDAIDKQTRPASGFAQRENPLLEQTDRLD